MPVLQIGAVVAFLIDGYNLMHAVGLGNRAMPAAKFEARPACSYSIGSPMREGPGRKFASCSMPQQAPMPSMESIHRGVRVRFAFHRTADDLIEELIATEVIAEIADRGVE